MQKLLEKLRFPIIVGSFVVFTWLGTNNFSSLYKDKLVDERKRITPDLKQDPEALAKFNEMKAKPWEK